MTTESPQVSVIIPSYNCATYLPQAIESVLAQTYNSYEIIVINDGSTDRTSEVIKPYLAKISYIEQNNQGVSAARNQGIALAKGELIAFLDADDIFLPHKLKEQVAVFAAQPHIGIVNSGYRIIEANGTAVMDVERWHQIPDLTPEVWLLHKPILPSAMMFRKEWFERVGGFDPRFCSSEDVEVTLKMVIQGCQSVWLPKITVYYRRHANSATWKHPRKQAKNSEQMQEHFFRRQDLPESIRRLENTSRCHHFSWLAWLCYQSGLVDDMAEYLAKSHHYAPYSGSELIATWIDTFSSCAKIYACDFDAYALSNLPQWQQTITKLKAAYLLKNYTPQVKQIQDLLTYQPDDSQTALYGQVYYETGKQLVKQQDIEQAIIFLRQAIELVPHNAFYHHELGNALHARYDLDSAIAAYRRAIKLKPNYSQFEQNLNTAKKLQSRWNQLINYCQVINNQDNLNNHRGINKSIKMLMIFPFPPYPAQKSATTRRMFEQIKYFGKRYHLTVVSFMFSEADYVIESQLADYCDRAFMVERGVPMAVAPKNSQNLLARLKTWNMWQTLQKLSHIDFDFVFFDCIFSTAYYPLFADRFTILNEHNIESKLLSTRLEANSTAAITNLHPELSKTNLSADHQHQAKLLAEYENQTWQKFSLRTVVNSEDKQELDSRCPNGKTLVVKNILNLQKTSTVEKTLVANSHPEPKEKFSINNRKIIAAKYDWKNIFAEYERKIWQSKSEAES